MTVRSGGNFASLSLMRESSPTFRSRLLMARPSAADGIIGRAVSRRLVRPLVRRRLPPVVGAIPAQMAVEAVPGRIGSGRCASERLHVEVVGHQPRVGAVGAHAPELRPLSVGHATEREQLTIGRPARSLILGSGHAGQQTTVGAIWMHDRDAAPAAGGLRLVTALGLDGRLLASVSASRAGDGPTWIDADARRLYRLLVGQQPLHGETGPWPEVLEAYDLASGRALGELVLPDVLGGVWETDRRVMLFPVMRQLQPGAALSPDGRHVAVIHADAEALTIVDTQHLVIERSAALSRPSGLQTLLTLFGSAPGTAWAKALEGTVRAAAFACDGRHLYVWGSSVSLDEHDTVHTHGRGLRRIDTDAATVEAEGLGTASADVVRPSPDGSALYVLGYQEPPPDAAPGAPPAVSLWRLDGATLAILAQRALPGFRQLLVTGGP